MVHACAQHDRANTAAALPRRALGDADLKDNGVTAEPEVTEVQLQPNDTFLILASDGLWDMLSNHDAVGLVHDTVKQPAMAAQR